MTDSILTSYRRQTTTTHVPFPAPVTVPLLVDTYTGAIAAYSFRKLRSAYAGSAVRIRRSSDNAQADIGFSGNDFDSAAAATHIGGGTGFIAKWYDQSGNGYDAIQGTSGNQPTYVASGLGSKPCLDFVAATPTWLKTGAGAVSLGGTTLSCFAVAILDSASDSSGRLVVFIEAASGNDYDNDTSAIIISRSSATEAVEFYRNTVTTGKATTYGVAKRYATVFTGSAANVFVNNSGGSSTSSSATWGGTGEIILGTGENGNVTGFLNYDGNCSEVVLWASNQTANQSGIDGNQSSYYGI